MQCISEEAGEVGGHNMHHGRVRCLPLMTEPNWGSLGERERAPH